MSASQSSVLQQASMYRMRKLSHAMPNQFSLEKTKENLYNEESKKWSPKFRAFYESELFDDFTRTMIRYFKYYFDVNQSKLFCTPTEDDELSPVLEPPTQSTEDLQNPLKASFEPKIKACQKSLSESYSKIILNFSDYNHAGRENRFFELFRSCLKKLITQAYNSSRKEELVEIELGRLFSSEHFNLSQRKYEGENIRYKFNIRETYALRYDESSTKTRNQLKEIFARPKRIVIHVARKDI